MNLLLFFSPLLHSNKRHQQSVHNTDKTNRASFVQPNFSRLIKMFFKCDAFFYFVFLCAIYSFFLLIWCLWLALQRKLIHYLLKFFLWLRFWWNFFSLLKATVFFRWRVFFLLRLNICLSLSSTIFIAAWLCLSP